MSAPPADYSSKKLSRTGLTNILSCSEVRDSEPQHRESGLLAALLLPSLAIALAMVGEESRTFCIERVAALLSGRLSGSQLVLALPLHLNFHRRSHAAFIATAPGNPVELTASPSARPCPFHCHLARFGSNLSLEGTPVPITIRTLIDVITPLGSATRVKVGCAPISHPSAVPFGICGFLRTRYLHQIQLMVGHIG